MRIAVLMTCHNRMAKTLSCLDSLDTQNSVPGLATEVWLVDDGSTDGTRAEVNRRYPNVSVLRGSGNLFWCGGMRMAWENAVASRPDAFLWLNDDVKLLPHALASLSAMAKSEPDSIIVGSCMNPETGARSYGGVKRKGHHPGKIGPVAPTSAPLDCDSFEGNIVWVPYAVFEKIGGLEPYRHAMGDIDYGYKAARAGVKRRIAPGFLGECSNNSLRGTWEDATLPRRERLKRLKSIKGLPRNDWWRFCRRNGGILGPWYFITPVLRVLSGR